MSFYLDPEKERSLDVVPTPEEQRRSNTVAEAIRHLHLVVGDIEPENNEPKNDIQEAA